MIVIDGQQKDVAVSSYENLEEVFNHVVEAGMLEDRVVTDVYLNEEPFTEIYPHQSGDIASSEVQSLEIRTVSVKEMAVDITRELYKVINIMGEGGDRVADLFRQADDAEALDSYQDLLDVARDFIQMIGLLREEFSLKDHAEFTAAAEEFSSLFTEMTEVLENEDWILMADLLEYEFRPAVEKWKRVVALLREDIRTTS